MDSLLFDTEPQTWQELEELVCQAFKEMGYETYRNKNINTVRGTAKVDVHATKKFTPIPTVTLVECKYWDKAVDQNVIYSFRSICADSGAHYGIIISKNGFQSGAHESREYDTSHKPSDFAFMKSVTRDLYPDGADYDRAEM